MELEKGHCLSCGATLEEVFPESEKWRQYKDAMDFRFVPGYGEKIDGDQLLAFHLCDVCSEKLFEVFPTIRDMLHHHSMSAPNNVVDFQNYRYN